MWLDDWHLSVPCGFSFFFVFARPRYVDVIIYGPFFFSFASLFKHEFRFVFVAEEVKAQSEKLERERRHNEALSSRLADMEATAGRREADMSELKRFLQVVKEEHQQVMQVRTAGYTMET